MPNEVIEHTVQVKKKKNHKKQPKTTSPPSSPWNL